MPIPSTERLDQVQTEVISFLKAIRTGLDLIQIEHDSEFAYNVSLNVGIDLVVAAIVERPTRKDMADMLMSVMQGMAERVEELANHVDANLEADSAIKKARKQ